MPELRQDIVTGQWVVVAMERAKRPSDFKKLESKVSPSGPADCPFCPGHEMMTPLELFAVRPDNPQPNTPGWQVRVVPNKYPAFESGESFESSSAIFPCRTADGSHEVIIHSPDHFASLATLSLEQVSMVLRVYRHRYRLNAEDPRVRYVHLIVNHGRESGASLEHPHSQLFGMPLIPPLLQLELAGANWHYTSKGKCVFCRIVEEETEAGVRVIHSDDLFVAIAPFASKLPFEVWIIPRFHQESFDSVDDHQLDAFAGVLKDVLWKYLDRFSDPPYNYYLHSAPCDGTSYPFYHWHLEAVPKLTTPGGLEMGTSMMINITTPEQAADHLKGGESF